MAILPRIYVYVIDGGQGLLDNPVDWIDSLLTIGDVTVTSVEDMVKKVEGKLGKSAIQNLFIGGHGAPGYQSVGAGTSRDRTGSKSLQVDPGTGRLKGAADQLLRRLAGRFAKDALVTLGGCQVGKDKKLLEAVSAAFSNVAVQAGSDNQRPLVPGMEGNVVRCKGTACSNLGGGSWWASPGSWVQ